MIKKSICNILGQKNQLVNAPLIVTIFISNLKVGVFLKSSIELAKISRN